MPERISKTQRWLDLIAYLLGRRLPVTVEEIMAAVPSYAVALAGGGDRAMASARRMFERDKDELRELGIPLRTQEYSIGGFEQVQGYSLSRRDFYLPYLRILEEERKSETDHARGPSEMMLGPEEARLAFAAVRRVADLPAFPYAAEARSAFRKLAFDLDADRLAGPDILWVDPPGAGELLERLELLSAALLARKRVRFAYRGIRRGQRTERDVLLRSLLPARLVPGGARRHPRRTAGVPGRSPRRSAPQRRLAEAAGLRDPRGVPAGGLSAAGGVGAGEGEEPAVQAEVLFHFPASLLAARNGSGALIEERADGSALRRFEVQQVDPFLRWVMSQEGEAEIVGPPELEQAMREMVDRVAALYGGEAANG
jgi:predicted DNA-binding transcriptional regulator YafY